MVAELTEQPSDSLMVYFLTQKVKKDFNYDVLIESPAEMIDSYFHFMKKRGIFDYVSDILPRFTNENGIRLDMEPNFPKTIIVKTITFQNIYGILGQIQYLSKLN